MKLDTHEVDAHLEACDGYCPVCETWTQGGVPHDTRSACCPTCGLNTLYGAAEALAEGIVEVVVPVYPVEEKTDG